MGYASAEQMQSVYSSLSNEELLRIVDQDFPNLKGALKMLRDKFEEAIKHETVEIVCSECGTVLILDNE